MASRAQLRNLQKCKNKFRHKWIDNGGKKRPVYCYTCAICGQNKIKSSTYHSTYYDNNMNYIGSLAPECKERINLLKI